jgi:hypothetical protein
MNLLSAIASVSITPPPTQGPPVLKTAMRLSIAFSALALLSLVTNLGIPAVASTDQMQRPFVQARSGAVSHLVRGATASTNWSGYATTGKSFSNVSGTWTQPAATCTSRQTQATSFWVGLDGYNSSTVEQTGTDSDCVNGHTQYYAWYELYPAGSAELSAATHPVAPGDVFTASVVNKNGKYTLTLSDKSVRAHSWTFTTTLSDPGATDTSAEWIAEAPSLCTATTCTVLPLSNFGNVNFSGSSTTGGGVTGSISNFTNSTITMVSNSGASEASPSGLFSSGSRFSVTYVPPAPSR